MKIHSMHGCACWNWRQAHTKPMYEVYTKSIERTGHAEGCSKNPAWRIALKMLEKRVVKKRFYVSCQWCAGQGRCVHGSNGEKLQTCLQCDGLGMREAPGDHGSVRRRLGYPIRALRHDQVAGWRKWSMEFEELRQEGFIKHYRRLGFHRLPDGIARRHFGREHQVPTPPPTSIKAISVRQPWAWLICNAGKDIENRRWRTHHRGPLLIHAAKGCTRAEFADVVAFCREHELPEPPPLKTLRRGGVVGRVDVVGCVRQSDSPWFMGPFGFQLENQSAMAFLPCSGQLGMWDIDLEELRERVGLEELMREERVSQASGADQMGLFR